MTKTEKRFYVMNRAGEQKHGPYLEKTEAIRDAGKEQFETHVKHHVVTKYEYK